MGSPILKYKVWNFFVHSQLFEETKSSQMALICVLKSLRLAGDL